MKFTFAQKFTFVAEQILESRNERKRLSEQGHQGPSPLW